MHQQNNPIHRNYSTGYNPIGKKGNNNMRDDQSQKSSVSIEHSSVGPLLSEYSMLQPEIEEFKGMP